MQKFEFLQQTLLGDLAMSWRERKKEREKERKKSVKRNMQVPGLAQLGCLSNHVPNTP
jgi:hypothetical protein